VSYKEQIPPLVLSTLVNWKERRITRTGSFVQAVLENNFVDAMGRADDESRAALHAIAKYLWNDMPSNCWGSPAKVAAWAQSVRAEVDDAA
jgi:hypothetical protein